jgi:Prenyltransferase and squalene oxidase repeat
MARSASAPLLVLTLVVALASPPWACAQKIDTPGATPPGFNERPRSPAGQLKEAGGSAASEAAVARGLQWLALHQAPDGHWSLDRFNEQARKKLDDQKYFDDRSTGKGMKNDTAGTAFGLLPFLAAGISHKADPRKKAPRFATYTKAVDRGLKYLLSKQDRDGAFPGGMYGQGLATIAICEFYGVTADPALRNPAQKAINYIVKAQHPKSGGWGAQPRQPGSMAMTGWQAMALKSGQMAGLDVPSSTWKRLEKWLDSVESKDKGRYGEMSSSPSYGPTAVGLLCRHYLGIPRRNPGLRSGCDWLIKNYPPSRTSNIYYEFHATQVMYFMGGAYWKKWNEGEAGKKGMRDILISRQDRDGSFDPGKDAYGRQHGRLTQTSLSLLTLEIYYRHQPLYSRINKSN